MINGIVGAPVLAIMMWLAGQRRIRSEFAIGLPPKIGGWIAAATVLPASPWALPQRQASHGFSSDEEQ